MFFKEFCIVVLKMKVASALEGIIMWYDVDFQWLDQRVLGRCRGASTPTLNITPQSQKLSGSVCTFNICTISLNRFSTPFCHFMSLRYVERFLSIYFRNPT